jgi:hypothetical protein
LQPLVTDGHREAYLAPNLEIVELTTRYTIAMEVDLAAAGGGNEPMVALGDERGVDAMRRDLVRLDRTGQLADLVLQLPAGRVE